MFDTGASAASLGPRPVGLSPIIPVDGSRTSIGHRQAAETQDRVSPTQSQGNAANAAIAAQSTLPTTADTSGKSQADQPSQQPLSEEKKSEYDPQEAFEVDAQRIAQLIERFDETRARIRRHIHVDDVNNPPGPAEIQQRLSDTNSDKQSGTANVSDVLARTESSRQAASAEKAASRAKNANPLDVLI